MSILRFSTQKNKLNPVIPIPTDEEQDPPHPHECENLNDIQVINEFVKPVVQETVWKAKKSKSYGKYDDEFKLNMANYYYYTTDGGINDVFKKLMKEEFGFF